ncbi:MAG: phosphotransferase [Lachnospiraceae bacterium]|nr:phosphotransferase [Lachnospiraceae bacterium]
MKYTVDDNKLIIYLEGRISSENAPQIQNEIFEIIDKNQDVLANNPEMVIELDVENLEYISSAGLRVLMLLKKKVKQNISIINTSLELYEIFDVTGFSNIFEVKKRVRNISIDGCDIVGQGAIGTVYRIDEDTIVKVYNEGTSMEEIEREKKMAKQAFIMGIPTAIAYDVVMVGERYGTVFEMLKAKNFNELLIEKPDEKEDIVRNYARFLRQVHSVEMVDSNLPDIRDLFLSFLDEIGDTLPKDLSDRLRELITGMPKCMTTIHGDVQMKNVMFDGDEPILIDMESLSVGNPVFELQALYITYVLYNEDEPGNSGRFLGIDDEMSEFVYNRSLDYYFEGYSDKEREEAERKIRIVAYIRFLHLICVRNIGLPELYETRVNHTIEHLREELPLITTLEI